jgi:hypothetical protein
MANDVLHGAGYDTVLLGGGITDEALSAALLKHRPAMVALSSTVAFPDALAATCAAIHETLPAAQLLIGGAAARKPLGNVPARYVQRLDGLLATVDAMLDPRTVARATAAEQLA